MSSCCWQFLFFSVFFFLAFLIAYPPSVGIPKECCRNSHSFSLARGPLSRKSLTEIRLVDKNMPAYTLFVQTNRHGHSNEGNWGNQGGGAWGYQGALAKFAWELRQLLRFGACSLLLTVVFPQKTLFFVLLICLCFGLWTMRVPTMRT